MIIQSAPLTKAQKEEAAEKIFDHSTPSVDFYLMLALSAIIVTLGLLINSPAVVIGGMLIAPILSPILSFALGIVIGDKRLIRRSGIVVIFSSLAVVGISFFIALLTIQKEIASEIASRTAPSMAYLLIAIVSGGAVAYALIKPKLSEILPGIAISVALIPPLATIGIALSFFEGKMSVGAFELFLVNLVGIILAASAVFSFMKLYEVRGVVEKKIQVEEKAVQKEQEEKNKEHLEAMEKTVAEVQELLNEQKDKSTDKK